MWQLISLFFFFSNIVEAQFGVKVEFELTPEPLDVIIPTATKDIDTLELAIEGIRQNCPEVRRIMVISENRLTDEAEWIDEAIYPFSKEEVARALARGNPQETKRLLKPNSRCGWYYQQLLKLYAPFVIENISSNVLVVDADTIFLNRITFLNKEYGAWLNGTDREAHEPYVIHGARLIPNFKRVYQNISGVTHHMLFQRPILADLFKLVELTHQREFWKVFCYSVPRGNLYQSGASEYEIYLNYALSRTDQVKLRELNWKNINTREKISHYRKKGYDYVSIHSWMVSSEPEEEPHQESFL